MQSGGHVQEVSGVVRFVVSDRMTQRPLCLALSRAIGDSAFTGFGLVATPQIQTTVFNTQSRCVVIASDGVWDFLTGQEVVNIVAEHFMDATEAAREVVREAKLRWAESEPDYRDDISVTVVLIRA